jgi:hypothetical protein
MEFVGCLNICTFLHSASRGGVQSSIMVDQGIIILLMLGSKRSMSFFLYSAVDLCISRDKRRA